MKRWLCCDRADEDEERPRNKLTKVRRVITEQPELEMPLDPAQSKAKPRTYGKKTNKFPVVAPAILKVPNSSVTNEKTRKNAPRDALAEVTETLGNIRINLPEVNSPAAWIDPDSVSIVSSKGKGKGVRSTETASVISKKSEKTSQSRGASNEKPSTGDDRSMSKSEDDWQTPEPASSRTSLRSKASSVITVIHHPIKDSGQERGSNTAQTDSPASRRSERVRETSRLSQDNTSLGSKSSSSSKNNAEQPPKLDSPSRSQRSHLSRSSSRDNSSIDQKTPSRIQREKGKGKEVEATESPARSQRSHVSRGSSVEKCSLDLERLHISHKEEKKPATAEHPKTPTRRKSGLRYHEPKGLLSPQPSPDSSIPPWLEPLASAYNSGPRTTQLIRQDWSTILCDIDKITKIAEASFAEVYRVEVADESSILKIITLKPPKGPGSKRYTAMPVHDVISEFRIMDVMSEIDGYLELKDAYLVGGKPTAEMIKAHDLFREEEKEKQALKGEEAEFYFPNPASYQKETMFFVLEMVDAGEDLGKFQIKGLVQVFDFFLQIALSLDGGERYFEFEHRDLHENNVCIRRRRGDPDKKDMDAIGERYKLYASGCEVTILDFTLSRAKVGPDSQDVMFYDLDIDKGLFEGEGMAQYQVYRDMRTHVVSQSPPSDSSYAEWTLHLPYTNVLWLRFILDFMVEKYYQYASEGQAIIRSAGGWKQQVLAERLEELEELQALLWGGEDGDGSVEGPFKSAGNVVDYAIMKGWIEEGDRL